MAINSVGSAVDIAVSGLRAETLRMNVIANNIANANTNQAADGQPYRRQDVKLSSVQGALLGVNTAEIIADFDSDFKQVYDPGNPNANEQGYMSMPNVDLPVEMMHMVTASRAYQANAAILKRYQEAVDVTVELLK